MASHPSIPIPKGRRLALALIFGGLWCGIVAYLVHAMLWPVARPAFAELPLSGDLTLVAITVLGVVAAAGRILPPIRRRKMRQPVVE